MKSLLRVWMARSENKKSKKSPDIYIWFQYLAKKIFLKD
jgi:hypothetical protein